MHPRLAAQPALFSLMPNPTASLDRRLMRHPDVYRRVVIPAAMKWEIRDTLDQANINEPVLHGGLDGLSRWLARGITGPTETSQLRLERRRDCSISTLIIPARLRSKRRWVPFRTPPAPSSTRAWLGLGSATQFPSVPSNGFRPCAMSGDRSGHPSVVRRHAPLHPPAGE